MNEFLDLLYMMMHFLCVYLYTPSPPPCKRNDDKMANICFHWDMYVLSYCPSTHIRLDIKMGKMDNSSLNDLNSKHII